MTCSHFLSLGQIWVPVCYVHAMKRDQHSANLINLALYFPLSTILEVAWFEASTEKKQHACKSTPLVWQQKYTTGYSVLRLLENTAPSLGTQ